MPPAAGPSGAAPVTTSSSSRPAQTPIPRRFKRFLSATPVQPEKPQGPDYHRTFRKLQVLTTFSSDSSTPSVVLSTQHHTYIFNCGEGMQRIYQTRLRVPKYSDIFLTRINWDVVGGLPGYLLTTAELMDSRTKVHGPKNLAHFLATFRHYLWRTSMDLHTNEFGESPAPYKDERVTVTPIPLSPHTPSQAPTPHDPEDPAKSSLEKLIRISPSTFTGTPSQILALKEAIVHEMFKKGTYDFDMNSPALFAQLSQDMKRRSSLINVPLPPTTPSSTTMAYFVKNHGILGKFDLEKAEALGVPRGRLYGKLKSGEDVEFEAANENGEMIVKVVKSEEVVQPAVEGHSVLVLDIPGLEYVDQVLKNDTLNADFVKGADVVVHMLGDEVATDKRYIDWMHSFKDSSLHLVMAPKLTPNNLTIPGSYMFDLDRNELDSSIFPRAHHDGGFKTKPKWREYIPSPPIPSPYKHERFITDIKVNSTVDLNKQVRYIGVEYEDEDTLLERVDPKEIAPLVDGIEEKRPNIESPGSDVEIITLGTGSAFSSKRRGMSCIAVRIPNESNIILDTGEHSLASLKRHLSPSEYHEFFSKLRLIYISHPHADHHLGLISIVKQYIQIQNTFPQSQRMPLFLIAPHRLFSSLYEYNQVEDLGIEGYVVPFASNTLIPRLLADAYEPPDLGLFQGFLSHMNLRSVETCFVPHCSQAYGVAITHKSGWKIVYSGDCRPSGDLVEIGQDATVLIHEATLAESQRPEAVDKMHSTTGEAITIGNRMRAKHILLTHFSQKWHTVPKFVLEWSEHKNEKEKYGNVGIAFDRMRVKIGEMWKLPLLYPAFAAMYGSPKTKRYVTHTKRVNQMDGGNGDETEEEEPIAKRRRMQESEQKEAIAIGK